MASIFDLPPELLAALWKEVGTVRNMLADLKPEGFNIGVNDGYAAGRTIIHAHIHMIPRRTGKIDDSCHPNSALPRSPATGLCKLQISARTVAIRSVAPIGAFLTSLKLFF